MEKTEKAKKLNAYQGSVAYFIAIVAFILLSFVGQAIFVAIFTVNSAIYIAICSTFSSVAFLGVCIFFSRKVEKPLENLLSVKKFNPIYIVLAIALSLGMFLGLGFLNTAVINFLKWLGISTSSSIIPLENIGHLILFILVLALLPAITEELFFRGALFNSLSSVKTLASIFTVSLCFALYHGSIQQLLYQFIYGVLLCILVRAGESVIPAIISHFINNCAVLVLEFYKVKINLFNPGLIAIGLLILGAFIFITLRIIKAKNTAKQGEKGGLKEFFIPCGIFALAICLTLVISVLFLGA